METMLMSLLDEGRSTNSSLTQPAIFHYFYAPQAEITSYPKNQKKPCSFNS